MNTDDLKMRIKILLEEIEFVHMKKEWSENLIRVGLNQDDVQMWASEIGHVIEEYQSSLTRLVDVLQETDPKVIPNRVYNWTVGRLEVTIPEIEDPMRYLREKLEKYLPAKPTEEEE